MFGSVAFVHIRSENRDKLDAKSQKCYFIGYGKDYFGYRFWNDKTKKVIRAKDVIFQEQNLYKHKDSAKTDGDDQFVEFEVDESLPAEDPLDISEKIADPELQDEDEEQEIPQHFVRRSTRPTKPPNRWDPSVNYLLLTDNGEPESFEEAQMQNDFEKWELAMKEELKSLEKNKTWQLVPLPQGKRALQNKWVFRLKEEPDGRKRYKARLVVKGFQQIQDLDYTEVFSPVVKMTTIRIILSIVAAKNLYLEQMDVKTVFLHGDLDEEIYMTQPDGFKVPNSKRNLVCRLQKSLYGLKQAPRQWYKKFDSYLSAIGFNRCDTDSCCYRKQLADCYIILVVYVDDMLIASANMKEINHLKKQLSKEFEMKDLGAAKQILGMRIIRDELSGILKLSQQRYIEKVLEKFSFANSRLTDLPLGANFKLTKEQSPKTEAERSQMESIPYSSAVGSLMYAMICTRPDIAHAVGVVSRFMSNPGVEHWKAVKWILRYLKRTSDVGLCFKKGQVELCGFCDADLTGDFDSSRSTSGYVFNIGSTAISWRSKLQSIVSLSTTEAEYVAVAEAVKEKMWLENMLTELGYKQTDSVLWCDSQSAIYLAKNPVFHSRTKHIRLKYHFIREQIEEEQLNLKKIAGTENAADMFTKVMNVQKLRLCMTLVGLRA